MNEDKTPRDCQGKCTNGNGTKPDQEVGIPVSEEPDELHKEVVFASRKYLGSEFDDMAGDKKIVSITIMHYENVLVQLRKKQLTFFFLCFDFCRL